MRVGRASRAARARTSGVVQIRARRLSAAWSQPRVPRHRPEKYSFLALLRSLHVCVNYDLSAKKRKVLFEKNIF